MNNMLRFYIAVTLLSMTYPANPQKISSSLQDAMENSPFSQIHAWVYFTDKNLTSAEIDSSLNMLPEVMNPRALRRRAKTRIGSLVDFRDISVSEEYVQQINAVGASIRTTTKWLNAVSISAFPGELSAISDFRFVDKMELVLGGKRMEPIVGSIPSGNVIPRTDYGNTFDQLDQINVIAAHEAGYTGQGVIVLMLDTGFYKDHESIHEDQIIDEWDFINNDGETQNEPGDPENSHNHGTYTLSTLGGSFEGQLYGPAYNAQFLLAKTEDVSQEVPVEEDWYVAGLEWGESLGADVASSSLGYIDWYTYEDLDGQSAVTTIAVNIAIENGMVITTAAGNSGSGGIIAPADAFEVLACGAVDSNGEIAGFSSWGPTADGRIKPDICARGVATFCADIVSPNSYREANGTSLSTPLVGGAAAVILSAHPSWTPLQVREALMMTADNVENPDNQYGWGVIDVMAAINYFNATGDVNNDGILDILDVVVTVNYILGTIIPNESQILIADMNEDGSLDVVDIVAMVSIIIGETF